MPSYNMITLVGHLGKAPEVKQSQGGRSYCQFSVATDDGYFVGQDWKGKVTWHNLVAFGKSSDGIARKALAPGDLVLVTGAYCDDSFDKDGRKVSRMVVHLTSLKLLKRKNEAALPVEPNGPDSEELPF